LDLPGAEVLACWEDGHLVARAGAPLSAGLFETLRAEDGVLRLVERHLERLAGGASRLGLEWPPGSDPREGLAAVGRELGERVARVRLTLGRDSEGAQRLRVEGRAYAPPREPFCLWLGEPGSAPEVHEPPALKRTEREPWERARTIARRAGASDVLLRDRAGRPVEGGACNVVLALGGRLVTPALATGALPGVLRGLLFDLSSEGALPFPLEEGLPSLEDLERADEVLVTSALLGIRGVAMVRSVDRERPFPGPRGVLAATLAALVEERSRREAGLR
jgi:branched-chain amino acid aminotransferase